MSKIRWTQWRQKLEQGRDPCLGVKDSTHYLDQSKSTHVHCMMSLKLRLISRYKSGNILGIDVASGLAVNALSIEKGHHVLDLCCAPGAKLAYMCKILEDNQVTIGDAISHNLRRMRMGTVTGVDIAEHRLCTCRALIKKYRLQNARLFLIDGTQFSHGAPETQNSSIKRTVKPFHESKLLRSHAFKTELYDRVLVDAECTHDGSISHLLKYVNEQSADGLWNWEKFCASGLDPERLANLRDLQRNLLQNGYSMLKPDGILVYSTCSLSRFQNEDVVDWFLSKNPDAVLDNIPDREILPRTRTLETSNSLTTERTIKFNACNLTDANGEEWWTSGLFIARILKKVE